MSPTFLFVSVYAVIRSLSQRRRVDQRHRCDRPRHLRSSRV